MKNKTDKKTGSVRLPIFLTGYMGSGKTTLGRALHRATGIPFFDLDEAVEGEAGMPVRRIFEVEGEDSFRRRETAMLRRLCRVRAIVACGGGTPCVPGNMDIINSNGTSIWLQADVERLSERLAEARHTRPLIAALSDSDLRDFVAHSLRQRTPFYSRSQYTFDANELDNQQQLDEAVRRFTDTFLGTENGQ